MAKTHLDEALINSSENLSNLNPSSIVDEERKLVYKVQKPALKVILHKEKVINVKRTKTDIQITVLDNFGTSTLTFTDINLARKKLRKRRYEIDQEWYEAIFLDKKEPKKIKQKKKNKKSKKAIKKVIDPAEELHKLQELEYRKALEIENIKRFWRPKLQEVIGPYSFSFRDLYSKLHELVKIPISESKLKRILSSSEDLICKTTNYGATYYSLRNYNKESFEFKPEFNEPQDVVEDCDVFKKEYNSLLRSPIRGDSEDIFIGLDFGTSFTKCAYQYDVNNKGVFLFGNSPFKSTIVYLTEDEKLSFFKPEGNSKQIQFFKATMISDKTKYSELRHSDFSFSSSLIKENFEMLCSSFFIANILSFIKHKLCSLFRLTPELQIAMGVPLFNNFKNQEIYNRALHAGIYISEQINNPSEMTLSEIYSLFMDSAKTFNNDFYSAYPDRISHCTIPELFTEALYLLNRTDYGAGYYFVVDIGGGTADFAFIKKEEEPITAFSKGSFSYHCPRASVVKLGNEVRKACGEDFELIMEYIRQFGLIYRKTIAQAKFALDIHEQITIKQLWFGGGAIDASHFYQDKLDRFQSGLNAISCTVINNSADDVINSFIPDSLNLTLEDKQRLIIATQLAMPSTSDAYLNSRPDNYDPTPKVLMKKQDIEDNNPGYDSVG